jgi:hypothetical protein
MDFSWCFLLSPHHVGSSPLWSESNRKNFCSGQSKSGNRKTNILQTKRTLKRQAELGICRAAAVFQAVYFEVRLELRE